MKIIVTKKMFVLPPFIETTNFKPSSPLNNKQPLHGHQNEWLTIYAKYFALCWRVQQIFNSLHNDLNTFANLSNSRQTVWTEKLLFSNMLLQETNRRNKKSLPIKINDHWNGNWFAIVNRGIWPFCIFSLQIFQMR